MSAVANDSIEHPPAVDAGAMQSWALWNLLGLFPVTSQVRELIGMQILY